jgi:hypothetical protein
MLSKVDHTVDCRDFKKKSQLLQLVDCRFFVDFAVDFYRISVGRWKNSYKMASKSSTISVKVNSRLRGRSEILRQSTFLEKVDHTVDYGFKSWPYCRLCFQKSTIQSTMVSKVDRTVDFSKRNPTTVDFSKKNPATVDLWPKVDCRLQGLRYIVTEFVLESIETYRVKSYDLYKLKTKYEKEFIMNFETGHCDGYKRDTVASHVYYIYCWPEHRCASWTCASAAKSA